jgi:hypothetical protein
VHRCIVVRTRFEAIHSWPECPHEDVAFLRHPHRHEFHVEMKVPVHHDDRDVEFIMAKRDLEACIKQNWQGQDLGRMSCEQMAERLLMFFSAASSCSVFEDGENGAEVYRE